MLVPIFLLSLIVGLMLAETRLSSRNQAALRAEGAWLPEGDVYRSMAIVYPASFLAMGAEGAWRAAHEGLLPGLVLAGALLFAASKALKYWAIQSLGERWSFRVLVQPEKPLIGGGPYQYIAHPNYVGVMGELVGTAMMMGAWVSGPAAVAVFGAILWRRIRFESRVLRHAYREHHE